MVLFGEGGGAHLEALAGESFLDLEQSQELILQADSAGYILGFFSFVEAVDLLQLAVQVVEENPVLLGMAHGVYQYSGLVEHADLVVGPVYGILVPLLTK